MFLGRTEIDDLATYYEIVEILSDLTQSSGQPRANRIKKTSSSES